MKKKVSQSGAAIVITAIFLIGILACVALALNIALMSISSQQQYSNASFVAESALKTFVPSNCKASQDALACLVNRYKNASCDFDVPGASKCSINGKSVPNGFDHDSEVLAKCCVIRSMQLATQAANRISGFNYYVGNLTGVALKTGDNQIGVPDSGNQGATINTSSPIQATNAVSVTDQSSNSGQLVFGYCRK